MHITTWQNSLVPQATAGKNLKHERANAYLMLQFHNHLLKIVPEFVLWSGVMRKFFNSKLIRATSCYVEGVFGQLKNSVLKRVQKSLRADKFFRIHFEALKGQVLISSAAITSFLSEKAGNRQNEKIFQSTASTSNLFNSDLCEVENWRNKIKNDRMKS